MSINLVVIFATLKNAMKLRVMCLIPWIKAVILDMVVIQHIHKGLRMPEDWDTLSEDEKTKRLDGVIGILTEKPGKKAKKVK